MLTAIILAVLTGMLVMLVLFTYYFRAVKNANDISVNDSEKRTETFQGLIYAAIVLVVIVILLFIYFAVRGTRSEGHLMEWLNIVVRVMHITFGIAWIGASFYFVFLENALNRTENVREELAGNLWAVHGGGFYYLEKYKNAPAEIPKKLHWFKYEAYFTWLSGFSLLVIVYYFDARGFLIDPQVLKLSTAAAISIGIGSLALGWLLYDLLCRSPLIRNGWLFSFVGILVASGFAYLYAQVFSGRAAYIHFGAMMGTIMAANVFFVIIPAQKALVKAAIGGVLPDPAIGKFAGLRSLHNNYLTLPVLFVMVSNHFPTTFGSDAPWIVLMAITLGTAGVKHYLNLREKGRYSVWVLPVSILILLATAFVTAPREKGVCQDTVLYAQVHSIIQSRCISCHSSKPTDNTITAPPNGIAYDTPQEIVKLREKIMQRVVVTKTMPQNNKTGMTEQEREVIRCWIEQGAVVK